MTPLGLATAVLLMTGAIPLAAQVTVATTAEATATIEPEVVLSPQAAAMREALVAAGPEFEPVLAVYERHGFAPLWSELKAASLLAALSSAGRHGLPIERYDIPWLEAVADGEGFYQSREVAFTRAFLTYARDVNSGLLEPRKVDRDIVVAPKRPRASSG